MTTTTPAARWWTIFLSLLLLLQSTTTMVHAFVVVVPSTTTTMIRNTPYLLHKASLFQDDPEMIEVAEHYLRAKYRQETDNGKDDMDIDHAKHVLRSLLPPVTPDELETEITSTLKNLKVGEKTIDEDTFVEAMSKNSYWEKAGDLVVKELMYFDALYHYYYDSDGGSLLNNDDYEELKENLTWEGSSVPVLNKQEALFITAVAGSKRGETILEDKEYSTLKSDLKSQKSWVTARNPDALEKHGLDTFLGYLHRSLEQA